MVLNMSKFDCQDLDTEPLCELENLEEAGDFRRVVTRKGRKFRLVIPVGGSR